MIYEENGQIIANELMVSCVLNWSSYHASRPVAAKLANAVVEQR
ncbi:hypothetical protein SAMN05428977_100197 [Nitrosomonas sp. Nm166]|nr:hypothetical protein SAMN05428977_100197 [Nitrosomonas sp. Nm166]